MKRTLFAIALCLGTAAPAFAADAPKDGKTPAATAPAAAAKAPEAKADAKPEAKEEKEQFGRMTVEELDAHMKKKDVFVFDSNAPEYRKKLGMIPGAIPLSSFNEYDVEKTLPKDKKANLVFYCANTH